MQTGKGQVLQLLLEDGCRYVRVACAPGLIPSPGQYLLASDGSGAPLPVSLFHTDSAPEGFIAAASVPDAWNPGTELYLRGPLGRGFTLPLSARKVGLLAFDDKRSSPARLRGLIRPALKQEAAVVLVCDSTPDSLPDEVEIHPLSAFQEIFEWADYLACDVQREDLNRLRERLAKQKQLPAGSKMQVLVHTPVPCGGVADCGICAVSLKSDWKLACKEGPVFNLRDILE
jgi:dihydroorotate dehydrogenase electron transfer subunit